MRFRICIKCGFHFRRGMSNRSRCELCIVEKIQNMKKIKVCLKCNKQFCPLNFNVDLCDHCRYERNLVKKANKGISNCLWCHKPFKSRSIRFCTISCQIQFYSWRTQIIVAFEGEEQRSTLKKLYADGIDCQEQLWNISREKWLVHVNKTKEEVKNAT